MKKLLLTVLMALTFTGLYPQENNSSIVVKEGKDGVFIFFSDILPFGDKANRFTEAVIYRSVSKPGNYSIIGNIYFFAAYAVSYIRIIGKRHRIKILNKDCFIYKRFPAAPISQSAYAFKIRLIFLKFI